MAFTPDMSGVAAPVSLIADPVFKYIAMAATSGVLSLSGGTQADMNSVDLFASNHLAAVPGGAALIVLNSTSMPLTLAGSFVSLADDGQKIYPAVWDFDNLKAATTHQIPAAPYPRPSRHQLLNNAGPAMMGGIGIYCFEGGIANHVNRAMAFACSKDGSATGPLLGVAFYCVPDPTGRIGSTAHLAVSADLASLGATDVDDNLQSSLETGVPGVSRTKASLRTTR
jgi:hypothetical protein